MRVWSLRVLATIVVLLGLAWLGTEADQWLLRWRAQRLHADLQTLHVGQSSEEDARHFLRTWKRWESSQPYCDERGCQYSVAMGHVLPHFLYGYPDPGVRNWLPKAISHVGLRSAFVGAGFTVLNGRVSSISLSEEVSLPPKVWFDRGGAWVPDLLVSSSEQGALTIYDGRGLEQHPHRIGRNFKGPYGAIIHFDPQETAEERAALMDFRFDCIAQFSPCLSEREILPEGWRMAFADKASR